MGLLAHGTESSQMELIMFLRVVLPRGPPVWTKEASIVEDLNPATPHLLWEEVIWEIGSTSGREDISLPSYM